MSGKNRIGGLLTEAKETTKVGEKKAVWKFVLKGKVAELQIPSGAERLSVGIQPVGPVLYFLVDPAAPPTTRKFFILETGEEADAGAFALSEFVGTFQGFHLFEIKGT